jgi:hypothetical protein
MTSENLETLLAVRVMGWTVGLDRFLTGNRGWLPRWKFQPTKKLADAIRLLEAATPQEYTVRMDVNGEFLATIRIGGTRVQASAKSKPLAICFALARSLAIDVESLP